MKKLWYLAGSLNLLNIPIASQINYFQTQRTQYAQVLREHQMLNNYMLDLDSV